MLLNQLLFLLPISIFIGLAQTAGIGGGPIINIFLMFKYQQKTSISLTYLFLIGGSLASIWKNVRKINPITKKSYISLDLILITLPISVSGTMIGTILKNYLSKGLTSLGFIFLFGLLFWDIRKTIKKIKAAQKINTIKQISTTTQRNLNSIQHASSQSFEIQPQNNNKTSKIQTKSNIQSKQSKNIQIPVIINQYKTYTKLLVTIFLAIICIILTVFLALVKGGVNFESIIGLQKCGFYGLFVLGGHFMFFILLNLFIAKKLFKGYKNKQTKENVDIKQENLQSGKKSIKIQLKQINNETEIQFNKKNIFKLLIIGFIAGIAGAAFGIGGAPILIPIWLRSSISPQTASSTTPALILINSLISCIISTFNCSYDQFSTQQIILFLLISFISTAVIKQIMTFIAQKYKLKGMVVITLLIIVGLSLIVFIPISLIEMVRDWSNFVKFGQMC